MSSQSEDKSTGRRVTTRELIAMKQRGEKIAALTCYDFLFARLFAGSDIDVVLVGDSLGQVMLGYDSTIPVTVDEMIHHASAVRRGLRGPLLVVDMPFLSYQVSTQQAMENCGRVIKESGAEAVKLEGGDERTVATIRALVTAGIPVMGHLGLTPQSVHQFGGYGVRGREAAEAERIEGEAVELQAAGCFAIVLEMLPTPLAGQVSESLEIPTIGIGAGPACDGQVLVLPDMLGLNEGFNPRFLRRFAQLAPAARDGIADFISAVKEGEYPGEQESYGD